MKKVAIVGANGKTGSNLVQEALKQGHDNGYPAKQRV